MGGAAGGGFPSWWMTFRYRQGVGTGAAVLEDGVNARGKGIVPRDAGGRKRYAGCGEKARGGAGREA
jgi:hypothetical protein